jgi:prepilin-type N-terminal cleavage/methylation domain-containing protein
MRSNRIRPSTPRGGGGTRRAGFTLMELLIVILIIGVLASIIVPMISKARQHANAANTRALVANLATMITAYRGDFNAYPGPLSNMEIAASMSGDAPNIAPGGAGATGANLAGPELGKITMSENLVLGLNGGLRMVRGTLQYNTAWVGLGPQWLGGTPRKLPSYGGKEGKDLSSRFDESAPNVITGDYKDSDGRTGDDTVVPEYQDRFNEPMPIIYMRARTGTRSNGASASDNPVITDGSDPGRSGQYDYSQYAGYVSGTGGNIGVGKIAHVSDYVPPGDYGPASAPNPKHGLREPVVTSTTDPASPGYTYPYNAYAAFRNHQVSGAVGAAPPNNPPEVAKQKDGFILISAGIDRIYGTTDDITNFGSY